MLIRIGFEKFVKSLLTKKMLEIRSADIFACGGSSLPIVCRLCLEQELSNLTRASQCRSTDFVSRMQDVTLVTQISITDWSFLF